MYLCLGLLDTQGRSTGGSTDQPHWRPTDFGRASTNFDSQCRIVVSDYFTNGFTFAPVLQLLKSFAYQLTWTKDVITIWLVVTSMASTYIHTFLASTMVNELLFNTNLCDPALAGIISNPCTGRLQDTNSPMSYLNKVINF